MGNGQAVVLGASMAGLLAARALADSHEQVTVVERDELVPGLAHRRGVPQGRHFHTMLLRGGQMLDSLFPGLLDELTEAGAVTTNLLRDARTVLSGYHLPRVETGARMIQLTRPLLETTVRNRLCALPN